MDPLALSIGPNEGSAAVLSKGSFQDFSKDILNMRYKEAEQNKLRNAKTLALLQDNVQSQFAQDNIKYFQPKMDEIRNYTTDLFQKRKGSLNEMDMFDIQTKWNKLKTEAEMSNNLYKEETERAKNLEEDPSGLKYDTEASAQLRSLYRNPWADPKLAKEVEDAGGIVKWRAQNAANFRNIPAYDIEKDYQESFGKDKLSKWYDPKWSDQGGFYEKKGYEGIAPDPEKFQQRVEQVWNRNDYSGKKFRQYHANWVSNNFDITDEGIAAKSERAKELLAKIPDTKGLTSSQKLQMLSFAHAVSDTEARFPTKELAPLTEKKRDVYNFGNGDSLYNKYNWTLGVGSDNFNIEDYKSIDPTTGKVNQKWTDYLGVLSRSNEYKNLSSEELDKVAQKKIKEAYIKKFGGNTTNDFVVVSAKKAEDNPVLTVVGKDGKSIDVGTAGFQKDPKTKEWTWIGSQELATKKSMQEILAEAIDAKNSLSNPLQPGTQKGPKDQFQTIKKNITKDEQLATQLASRYGFRTLKDFYEHLDKLAAQNKTVKL